MGIRTLLHYLIGNRQAIHDIAADRRALWVGLLFVLSAGLARDYDGEDLLLEPWHLLVPVGASLAMSFLLFLAAAGPLYSSERERPPFLRAYRAFLTLFWMTAPLAWLYAIPYERFLPPADATAANLRTLGFVAAWRVFLTVRVVSVLTGRGVVASFFLVMALADVAALFALFTMPGPAVSFMGGIRYTPSEQVIVDTTCRLKALGILSAPIWFVGTLIALCAGEPTWKARFADVPPARSVWVLAGASLAVWLPILPWTQAEQRLRTRAEHDLRAGRIAEALDLMSAHRPSDFPPQWDPPPRIGYGEKVPPLTDVMATLLDRRSADWLRSCYLEKFRQFLGSENSYYGSADQLNLTAVVRILARLPEGPAIAAGVDPFVKERLERGAEELPTKEREQLKALLKTSDQEGVRDRP